ncbi:CHAT domain-containing protein [Pedobacter changchengzhani]|uniref:CHAT domain-containing protein n=1 Tax=Pedobacter changchengzhani TaxID=2529274 RepID=A0A4R5MKX0_9SPHI|nr:CHAT domain-containing tetratricopeptide repeat protein [Pedobacter changchengzhani]TDG36311.1 CHAT domain-containing protein [Pedobacter changchengzhani]
MFRKILFFCFLFFASVGAMAQLNQDALRKIYFRLATDSTKKDSTLLIAFKIKDAAVKEFGSQSMEYFRALNNIGVTYSEREDFENAAIWWRKAYNEIQKVKDFENITTTEFIYSNLKMRYLYHVKNIDSANFFSAKYLDFKLKNTRDKRTNLNVVADVANSFEEAFGAQSASRYCKQVLILRKELFGNRNAEIIYEIDSILCKSKLKNLQDWRYNLYSVLDTVYSLAKIDSMSRAELDKGNSWKSIYYAKEMMDLTSLNGDTSEKFIVSLQRLGLAYQDYLEQDSLAKYCMFKALNILAKNGLQNSVKTVDVLADLHAIYFKQHDFKNAVVLESELLSISKMLPDSLKTYVAALKAIGSQYNSSDAKYDLKNYQKSSEYLRQSANLALTIYGNKNKTYSQVLTSLGGTYIHYGQLDSAEIAYLKAYSAYHDVNTDLTYKLARQLQYVYDYKGEDAKSNIWLQKALEIKKLNGDTVNFNFINDLYGLVAGATALKDWKNAERALSRMEKILIENFDTKSQEYERYRSVKVSYGLQSGNFSGLDTLMLNNIKLIEDTSTYDQNKSEILRSKKNYYQMLAEVYLRQGNLKLAQQTNEYAFKLSNFDSTQVYLFTQKAAIMSKLHKTDSAIFYYKKAIVALGDKTSSSSEIAIPDVKMSMADVYFNVGNYLEAESLMRESLTQINDFMILNMAGFSEKEKRLYNRTLQENLYKYFSVQSILYKNKPEINKTAYNFVVQTKGLLLNTSDYLVKMINSSGNDTLKQQYAQLKDVRKQLASAYQNGPNKLSIKDSLENIAKKLEQQLSFNSESFKQFQDQNNIDFETIKNKLGANEAAIEFVEFPYYNGEKLTDSLIYAAYIIKPNTKYPEFVVLKDGNLINSFVKNQGVNGRGILLDDQLKNPEAYKALYNCIWLPLKNQLAHVRKLYISADGITNNVSFASLEDSSGNYLIDKYDLRFVLSTKDIKNNISSDFKIDKSIALFGGAQYDLANTNITNDALLGNRSLPSDATGQSKWNYLPNTLKEINSITSMLKKNNWKVDKFAGADASESSFKELSGSKSPSIIHISTHGFYFPLNTNISGKALSYNHLENPLLRTGLVFSAANEAWLGKAVENGKEDGILTAYELSNLDLSNTKLAVLSACETGVGENVSGEGVFGLQRALKMAGVDKMIVSLWPVPDKETAEMMQKFYGNIAIGKNIAESFNLAQTEMRKLYGAKPALWAGFVLIE